MLKISPKYIIDLINKINEKLYAEYASYKKVQTYIERWREVVRYESWGYNNSEEHPIYDFDIKFKENTTNIDLIETLNNIEDEKLLQIAIDLELEVPGFIYSVAKIEGITKQNYQIANQIFVDSIKKVYDRPDEAIGLANSALESIIKHILELNKLEVEYNPNDTLYKQTSNILKGLNFFPNKDLEESIKRIGSSLLCITQEIEALRSDKTKFHGKGREQYIIDDPLYAFFVINCVSTIGHFLISYFEKTHIDATTQAEELPADEIPF